MFVPVVDTSKIFDTVPLVSFNSKLIIVLSPVELMIIFPISEPLKIFSFIVVVKFEIIGLVS